MKYTKLVTIAALLGYTLAVGGSIKQRLSEVAANNQIDQAGCLPVCDLPILGAPDLSFCPGAL